MMTLAAAASYFDRTPILNPDDGTVLFLGQIDPYDDSKRDAGAAYRRVLSVAPGTLIPANRSVRIFNQPWLVGRQEIDGLAEEHREKYVLQAATARAAVSRLSGFLAGTVALQTWAGVEWLKDVKEIEVSSRMPEQCTIFFPLGTAVQPRDVVSYAGSALMVLEVREQPSGYTVGTALRLEQAAPAAAQLVRRTYQPLTGTFTAAAPEALNCLRVRWQNLFEYSSQADARYQEGDCSLVLPAATSLSTRDRITYDGVTWSVVSVDELAGAVVAHARPA